MSDIHLLMIGGVPDDNMVEVRSWSPNGVDLLFDGNVTVDAIRRAPLIKPMHLILGGSLASTKFNLHRRPDVVLNLICNPESSTRALRLAESICEEMKTAGIPVLNPPDRVRENTRAASQSLLSGLNRIRIPPVRRLKSPTQGEVVTLLSGENINLPVIVRTVGDHNGLHMVRIRNREDFASLDQMPFDGRDYYIIGFCDYKNSDGLYRKLRLIKVGRAVWPRHLITSENWKIHVAQRNEDFNFSIDARAREDAYLNDPKTFLGKPLYDQLVTALRRTGLDYVGMDFGLTDAGDAIFFECNACTNAATLSPKSGEPIKRAEVKRNIEMSFYECVREAVQLEQ